jgi:hypothetical protein
MKELSLSHIFSTSEKSQKKKPKCQFTFVCQYDDIKLHLAAAKKKSTGSTSRKGSAIITKAHASLIPHRSRSGS